MILGMYTPASRIVIWSPKYSTREILIAKHKVARHNEITFTKAKSLPDTYYLSGETIRKYPITTNGKLPCYAVDMAELETLERVAA